jgi:hypothetical protein
MPYGTRPSAGSAILCFYTQSGLWVETPNLSLTPSGLAAHCASSQIRRRSPD